MYSLILSESTSIVMGFEKGSNIPKKKEMTEKVIKNNNVQKKPELKLITDEEVRKSRIHAYEFAI